LHVSHPEREAFQLWMGSGEKVGGERIAAQKQAISKLKAIVEDRGFEEGFRLYLTVTLRKWNGMVATEEGNWIAARFEFSQGRSQAATHDPGSIPWFDAAVAETEVWSALTSSRLSPDALEGLSKRLDEVSVLYAAGSDRSNAEFTSDWSRWLKLFIEPGVPPQPLADRILTYVETRTPEGEPGAELPVREVPLAKDAFEWNYFWLSRLARGTEASLRETFGEDAPLEALARGAAALAAPPKDFGELLALDLTREREAPAPESYPQLRERLEADLARLRRLEESSRDYLAEVRRQWASAPRKTREQVARAIFPERKLVP
jgi:hypothetical protein